MDDWGVPWGTSILGNHHVGMSVMDRDLLRNMPKEPYLPKIKLVGGCETMLVTTLDWPNSSHWLLILYPNGLLNVSRYWFLILYIYISYILNYTISYHTISYCIILYQIILYYIILYHIISDHIIWYYIIWYHIIWYYIIWYYIILYHIIWYYIIL